ncbi:MAG TPA: hypothetical protein VKV33_07425 [Streptosporangiaceae bacterium]|nr:hypothetical protein [Streptosporangiaceae bacterium]
MRTGQPGAATPGSPGANGPVGCAATARSPSTPRPSMSARFIVTTGPEGNEFCLD